MLPLWQHRRVDERSAHALAAIGLVVLGLLVARMLGRISAPYGRHRRPGWGPELPAKVGWMVMESPALLVFAGVFFVGEHAFEPVPLVFAAMWGWHYVHRAVLQPLRMKSESGIPLAVVAMAIAFNVLNGWLNARFVSHLGEYELRWLFDPRFMLGALLFFVGGRIHRAADQKLLALRREGKGYQIPHGGLFEWVACPNYFGEILQWFGWALATCSVSGLSFAAFTLANLAPRAKTHREWYFQTFPDFPRARKALVPLLW